MKLHEERLIRLGEKVEQSADETKLKPRPANCCTLKRICRKISERKTRGPGDPRYSLIHASWRKPAGGVLPGYLERSAYAMPVQSFHSIVSTALFGHTYGRFVIVVSGVDPAFVGQQQLHNLSIIA